MTEFTDYVAALERVKQQIQELAPGRLVTREFMDFENHPPEQITNGVITIVAGSRIDYDAEYRPGDLARFEFFVYGEGRLAEDATGEQIEAAEFELGRVFEQLAAEHDPENLAELLLISVTPSFQTAKPYYSSLAVFQMRVDSE